MLSRATKAGEESIIGEEKERVAMAYNGALTEKYKTDINAVVNADDIQAELNRNRTDAIASGTGTIEILFNETNHIYYIDIAGEITGPMLNDPNEQANIFEYTDEGWITGIKEEYLEDIDWVQSSLNDVSIASKYISNLSIALNGENGMHGYLVATLSKTLKIPNKIGNTKIIGIDEEAFAGIDNLEKVIMADGIKQLRQGVFRDCANLKSVKLSKDIENISAGAFEECKSLNNIEIPNSVTSIEEAAFGGCRSLTNIKFPNSVKVIGCDAFGNCYGLNNLELSNVETIKAQAFAYCEALTSIEFPSNIKRIDGGAFFGCENLENITIVNDNVEIGSDAFYNTAWHDNLSNGEIYIGNIYYEYKGNMPSDTSITIRDGTKKIAGGAFAGCSNLTSIVIPNSVTSIGDYAFYQCRGLTSIHMPDSVTNLGDYAFYGCTGLIDVNISKNLTNISNGAFYNCRGLTSIEIPENVTTIDCYAFSDCSSLTSVIIPNNVTIIGGGAFRSCTNLRKIYIPSLVTVINEGEYITEPTFQGCSPSLVIYCGYKQNEIPSEWDELWNYYNWNDALTVEYNSSLEDFMDA